MTTASIILKSLPVLAFSLTGQTQAALHLAYGVDIGELSASNGQIRIFDLHNDHYHSFTTNNGTNPGGHQAMAFQIVPGASSVSLTMASMDTSPFNESHSQYTTNLIPAGDFHLQLDSITDESGDSSSALTVAFWHGDHTHSMSDGTEEHIDPVETQKIDFSLDANSALGTYYANFRLADEGGNYVDSPAFRIQVNAVPEPSTGLLIGCVFLGAVARRRR